MEAGCKQGVVHVEAAVTIDKPAPRAVWCVLATRPGASGTLSVARLTCQSPTELSRALFQEDTS
jgi:hypothetical protein